MLTGKNILIVGGSGGIGAAIAQHCAMQNAQITITYNTNKDAALECLQIVSQHDTNAQCIRLDITDDKQCQRVLDRLTTNKHILDGVVNASGIHISGPLPAMSDEDIDAQIAVNLSAAIKLTRNALKHMLSQRQGCILHLSSVSAHRMTRGHAVYSASKSGLEGFCRAMAAEVAKRNIRINCLAPGPVLTPMLENSMQLTGDDPSKRVPMGRLIKAEEIGAACAYLLSDAAQSITGTVLPVDGGYTLW